jgi:type IV pilus assembly protein PilC
MPQRYEYEAKNPQGKIIKGEMTAESEKQVENILWKNHFAVISVSIKKSIFKVNIFSRISVRDKAVFARQTATMLTAGFPLLQAMSVIVLQTPNEKFKEIINSIIKDLEDGHPFSVALAKHPKFFNEVYINLVKSGEATGKLPKVMEEIATDIEKQAALNAKIRGAMYYPTFVFVALIAIAGLMMVKVIPQLKTIFEEAGARLPWTTRAVMWISGFLINYWWAVIIGVILLAILIRFYVKSKSGRKNYDKLKVKMPLTKELTKNIYMERFARTFSLLAFAGVPILETIRISAKVIGNVLYEEALDNAYREVEKGVPLSNPLAKVVKLFPPMVSQMIAVGEKTGKLESILKSLSEYYQEEVDRQVKALSSLIEPILIIIIGIGVGIMVFSVIVPIYQIAQLNM